LSKLVQSITLKVQENHEQALKEIKELKTFLEGKGVGVRAFWTLEAGVESGTGVVAMEFPDAAAWAALVDSQDPEIQAMRRRGVEHPNVVIATTLLQEVDLS
jgi:hypothetical protein